MAASTPKTRPFLTAPPCATPSSKNRERRPLRRWTGWKSTPGTGQAPSPSCRATCRARIGRSLARQPSGRKCVPTSTRHRNDPRNAAPATCPIWHHGHRRGRAARSIGGACRDLYPHQTGSLASAPLEMPLPLDDARPHVRRPERRRSLRAGFAGSIGHPHTTAHLEKRVYAAVPPSPFLPLSLVPPPPPKPT